MYVPDYLSQQRLANVAVHSGFKYAQLELSASCTPVCFDLLLMRLAEVILSVLLSRLKFEPTDKPIVWNHATVMYPTVGKESRRPELHLRVSLVSG